MGGVERTQSVDTREARAESLRGLYLDLLEKCILNTIYEDPSLKRKHGSTFDLERRIRGADWPSKAHTMIGQLRLRNLHECVEQVLAEGIPGDLIETGVWRGGACIYMRGMLKAWGVVDRRVWVADSFAGLPAPDPARYPLDSRSKLHWKSTLRVSIEEVQANFAKYGLLDDQVRFLKGWFKDTLPRAPIERLAVLRLDGDMYESTMDGLTHLYDKLSTGGFLIVDDFRTVRGCREAVNDFRRSRGITDEIEAIDHTGVFWRKT